MGNGSYGHGMKGSSGMKGGYRSKSLESRPGDRGDSSNRTGRTSVSSVRSRGMPSSIKSTSSEAAAPGGELSGGGNKVKR